MKRSSWLVFLSLLGCQLLLALSAPAADIYVPSGTITNIQDGIDVASNGDTVIVADGTYPGRITFDGKLVTVRSDNGPQNCIIDGGDATRGVTFTKGETDQAKLEGFTIRNCRFPQGGGIHIESKSSPLISNCIISQNFSDLEGGGIFCCNSSPTISNCTISGNSAACGGGIWLVDNSLPRITNSIISGNLSVYQGGGISVAHSSPTIKGCTISGNRAIYANGGGAIFCNVDSAVTIGSCTIRDNYSGEFGGGINCGSSVLWIYNTTISGNYAVDSGGAIAFGATSSGVIINCVISGNSSPGQSSSGNIGSGGIYCFRCFPTIINCSIVGNTSASDHGGGILSRDSVPTILNSIFWGNSPRQIDVHNSIYYPKRAPVVSYSDIQGTYLGTGNTSADPLFVNAAAGDFHLQSGSPCIDTASNADAPAADMDGIARPQDGNGDGIAIADMGAYEFVGPPGLSSIFGNDPSSPEYLPDAAFRNPQNRTALRNKVEAVLQMIQRGDYQQALDKLQNDILKKVDGCAVSGAPDSDDWIVDCTYQAIAYQRVTRAIEALRVILGEQ